MAFDSSADHTKHILPATAEAWEALGHCSACGLSLLRLYLRSASWVVRRVENVEFLDDRTVRRRTSVDYASPEGAVKLYRPSDDRFIRIVPLTVLRRKSLVKFDLRDEDGRPMPLLGLRETQALTLAIARAWAAMAIGSGRPPSLPDAVERFVKEAVAGDQAEMDDAYDTLNAAQDGPLAELKRDVPFRAVLDRLAGTFILFTIDEGAAGSRRIVKFAYDEPLTLRYSTSSYQGHEDGPSPPAPAVGDPDPLTYGNGGRRMWRWERPARLASLGMTPTLIRFPVPAAELAASFHFEVSAPPDVSIVEASLLAGPPNLYMGESPEEDLRAWKASSNGRTLRRRPSFDSVDGGYPTVDLHVIDVPLGSLSRAQVSLQASTTGWLTTAVASTWLATATLLVGFLANSPAGDLATTVLIGFAAAMVAALARPDPHRMVTRLLSLVRVLVGASAVLTLGGAVAVAFAGGGVAHWCLGIFTLLSCVPTFLVTGTWWRARRRITRENVPVRVPDRLPRPLLERLREKQATQLVRLSPWEQHLPDDIPPSETNPDFHVDLARDLDAAPYPYDEAIKRLGFDKPAIKVATSEGVRRDFLWNRAFHDEIARRLDRPSWRHKGAAADPGAEATRGRRVGDSGVSSAA